eukprot:1157362-Pelagomonas_calceolata.AAC.13
MDTDCICREKSTNVPLTHTRAHAPLAGVKPRCGSTGSAGWASPCLRYMAQHPSSSSNSLTGMVLRRKTCACGGLHQGQHWPPCYTSRTSPGEVRHPLMAVCRTFPTDVRWPSYCSVAHPSSRQLCLSLCHSAGGGADGKLCQHDHWLSLHPGFHANIPMLAPSLITAMCPQFAV